MSPEERKQLDELNELTVDVVHRLYEDAHRDVAHEIGNIRRQCDKTLELYACENIENLPEESRAAFILFLGEILMFRLISDPAVFNYMQWAIKQRGGEVLRPAEVRVEILNLLSGAALRHAIPTTASTLPELEVKTGLRLVQNPAAPKGE